MSHHRFKSLEKEIRAVASSHTPWEVWTDFLELSFRALNAWRHDESNEQAYLAVAGKYKSEDLTRFARCLAIVVEALEEGPQDFLGYSHMALQLGNAATGQFFTPYSICAVMAQTTIPERPTNFPVTISDPACGAGANLIAAIDRLFHLGVPQERIYAEGTDIDLRACRMASVQLTLLGVPARVIHGNSLSGEVYGSFETMHYWASGMCFRLGRTRDRMPNPSRHSEGVASHPANHLSNDRQGDLFGGAA